MGLKGRSRSNPPKSGSLPGSERSSCRRLTFDGQLEDEGNWDALRESAQRLAEQSAELHRLSKMLRARSLSQVREHEEASCDWPEVVSLSSPANFSAATAAGADAAAGDGVSAASKTFRDPAEGPKCTVTGVAEVPHVSQVPAATARYALQGDRWQLQEVDESSEAAALEQSAELTGSIAKHMGLKGRQGPSLPEETVRQRAASPGAAAASGAAGGAGGASAESHLPAVPKACYRDILRCRPRRASDASQDSVTFRPQALQVRSMVIPVRSATPLTSISSRTLASPISGTCQASSPVGTGVSRRSPMTSCWSRDKGDLAWRRSGTTASSRATSPTGQARPSRDSAASSCQTTSGLGGGGSMSSSRSLNQTSPRRTSLIQVPHSMASPQGTPMRQQSPGRREGPRSSPAPSPGPSGKLTLRRCSSPGDWRAVQKTPSSPRRSRGSKEAVEQTSELTEASQDETRAEIRRLEAYRAEEAKKSRALRAGLEAWRSEEAKRREELLQMTVSTQMSVSTLQGIGDQRVERTGDGGYRRRRASMQA
mmetsp:Transcript_55604/g.120036  ORF Transcript_55604/g.120036 Transcript_55604/m.120036 type:complete len:540 (+) Transcript_55604:77-1696(+)|eukprot:CAMPEP_0170615314 /NCGR_PEP_ID=MMETSP0224-20130122/25268_1 /TAXON_ID=285029 /ORGANISM="Togula jolla, Strain CCCM 725" /LENGTH=539 /DNA_ID=CAMNT_0010941031 /DNA_START=35 /DNA_END=1654 /DNA_ORIENTATION=-